MSAKSLPQLHLHRSTRSIPEAQLAQRLPASPPLLPALPAQFIGRQAETQQAIALWQRLRPRNAPRVMAIVGQAGVGKSAFAVHLAHQLRSRFTSRQVYVNLRSESLAPTALEQQICRALSVEQLGELSDRRILLLLDAIETTDQLQPLLKLSEDCTIIVTSTQPLAAIAAIELQPLSSADGIALLQAIAAVKPTLAEAKTAKAIVQLCDNLPLPLCLIAALLQQPQLQLDDCWQQLADERKRCEQAHLSNPAIRASFLLSYRRLDAPTARLLRRIGVLAEPTLTAETAAALGETSIESAQASLALLRRMRLLEVAETHDRLPDLLRSLVKSQLAIEESTETRQAVRLRLAQHYQEIAEIWGSCWDASRPLFERDRSNFLAAIDWAIQAQAWPIAISTIASLTPFMLDRGDAANWLQRLQTAIAIAESSDALQVAQLHNHLGNTYAHLGDWEKAKAHYQQSLQQLQDRQEPIREAQTIANLGLVYLQQNNLEAAAMQWAIALGRLPAGSAADRAMIQWMQSIDEALLQKAESRVDRPASSNFLGAIGGIFKRMIS